HGPDQGQPAVADRQRAVLVGLDLIRAPPGDATGRHRCCPPVGLEGSAYWLEPSASRLRQPPEPRAGAPGLRFRSMRSMPTVLLLLSFPAGAIAYALTVRALEALELSGDGREILVLFVPLFVAGLVMMPFLIPYLDRRAKEDLAAITRDRTTGDGPDAEPSR